VTHAHSDRKEATPERFGDRCGRLTADFLEPGEMGLHAGSELGGHALYEVFNRALAIIVLVALKRPGHKDRIAILVSDVKQQEETPSQCHPDLRGVVEVPGRRAP